MRLVLGILPFEIGQIDQSRWLNTHAFEFTERCDMRRTALSARTAEVDNIDSLEHLDLCGLRIAVHHNHALVPHCFDQVDNLGVELLFRASNTEPLVSRTKAMTPSAGSSCIGKLRSRCICHWFGRAYELWSAPSLQ